MINNTLIINTLLIIITRNNTAPNATATDTANNNAFGEKKVGF